jgi:glycosyltransferase involved in cell wall biosynthesis
VSGLPELIIDGVTGVLSEPRSPAQLAFALSRLIGEPDLRRSLAAAGMARATSEFSLEAGVDRLALRFSESLARR